MTSVAKTLEYKLLLAPSARSQIYNITLSIRERERERDALCGPHSHSFHLSSSPLLSPPHSTLPSFPLWSLSFPLARDEECYPVVAGHRATRRQAITAAEQEKEREREKEDVKKGGWMKEQRSGMDVHDRIIFSFTSSVPLLSLSSSFFLQ